MIGQRELTLEDYKAILQRRKWLLIVPAIILSITAYSVSKLLPSRYTSETTVLVEGQRVSPDLVNPVIRTDINQRLMSMQEQILSRTRMQRLIEMFNLYKEEAGRVPMEDLVQRLKKSITVSPVRAMAGTGGGGLPGFSVSVVASQPQLAQQLCTEITSMFMQQNVLDLSQSAEDTTDFLLKQLNDAKTKLDDQDAKLADFQRRYMGQLPDDMRLNFDLLSGLSSQLDAVNQALGRAQQDRVFLESTLNQQLAALKVTKAGESPDVLAGQLAGLQNQLATLQGRYTDEYPDVVKVKKEIANLQEKIRDQAEAAKNQPAPKVDKEDGPAETPQTQQLRVQLHQLDVSIKEKIAEQARIQQHMGQVQSKVQLSPAIAQEYKGLTRDYQTAYEIYNDLLKKVNTAKISNDLNRRQQGEQFRVLDAPSLPQKPTFPNRPLFAFGGFFGGLGLGAVIAFILEAKDTTLRGERDVEVTLKLPTLALIPAVRVVKGSRGNTLGEITASQKIEHGNSEIGA